VLAVARYDLAIILKTVLLDPFECPVSAVVHVDVDETVPLRHLAGALAHQIDAAPPCVSDEIDAVHVDGVAHGPNMLGKVFNPVRIVHPPVRLDGVLRAQAVLNDQQGFAVPVVEFDE